MITTVQTFTPLKFVFLCDIHKNHMGCSVRRNCAYAEGQADYPRCQPTIAAHLLLDGGKIEPYTMIIMITELVVKKKVDQKNPKNLVFDSCKG
jgi:hypothetical protein